MEFTFTSKHKIVSAAIEKTCKAVGLQLTMKTSLKTLPDNEHWHFKRGKLKGVLEITLLAQTNELVLSCKKNRQAEWMDSSVVELSQALKLIKA